MNNQELINKYENKLKDVQLKFGANFKTKVYEELLEDFKQLDEPQKPVVKRFVAEWYEANKDEFEYNLWDWISSKDEPEKIHSEFAFWVNDVDNNPIQTLVDMHQFGYTVEKEKRYEVILSNGQSLKTVYRQGEDRLDFEKVYGDIERFTRKQLEEAGFGWVFDCEGMEVKEVE